MAWTDYYSARNKLRHSGLQAEIPDDVRIRIIRQLRCLRDGVQRVLATIMSRLLDRFGSIRTNGNPYPNPGDPESVLGHFHSCNTEEAIDFIEAIFQSTQDGEGAIHLGNEINTIFRQEGIGYELTPMTREIVPGGGELYGHRVDAINYLYPEIRVRSNAPQDAESMKPCLDLLTNPLFKIANGQFLKAHRHYRAGEWDQTIAYCGSAFESALKTVLAEKGRNPAPNATANALIQECVAAGIFPATYQNSLIGIANVRNAMSDTTHGRTPATIIAPDQKNAEYLLYVTAASIVFVAKCA